MAHTIQSFQSRVNNANGKFAQFTVAAGDDPVIISRPRGTDSSAIVTIRANITAGASVTVEDSISPEIPQAVTDTDTANWASVTWADDSTGAITTTNTTQTLGAFEGWKITVTGTESVEMEFSVV